MKQSFFLKDLFQNDFKKSFLSYSSIKIKNFVDKELCDNACQYIYENESRIINEYKFDSKGLAIDKVKDNNYIKYFEYPFRENSELFGQFVTSNIFKISEFLLDGPVFLKSLEIHSRCANGTRIPPHQDNAYYGLKGGRGLTFYIPINKEIASKGGLKYYKNSNNVEMAHVPSDCSGFSLTVDKSEEIKFDIFAPNYLPGDCTVHHSRSIHFAEEVPSNADRSLVVRLSVYAITESLKDGHADWYKNMIKINREQFSNY